MPRAGQGTESLGLQGMDPERHVLAPGMRAEVAVRWTLIALLLAFVVAALANVFGQRAVDARNAAPGASLTVHMPQQVRSGDLFQGRITITAHRRLADATLVMRKGWWDGMTINGQAPDASDWSADGNAVSAHFGTLDPGDTMTFYLSLEVNPTTFGRRDAHVELRDGAQPVAGVDRHITIYP